MRKLKTYFWGLVAKELVKFQTLPDGQEFRRYWPIFSYAKTKPYFHLEGYMNRWWLMRHPARVGEPGYDTFRNFLRRLYPFYARFHFILRADDDRHPHNHPFAFISMIMSGWYEEEITQADGSVVIVRYDRGDINYKPVEGVYHRITKVSPEGVLTLVIMGRRDTKSWGFMVNGEHIHHVKYLGLGHE